MKLSMNDIDSVVASYLMGAQTIDLARQHNVSQHCIIYNLKKKNIKCRGNVKYKINNTLFNKIDSPSKAYFLGFALGDGHIYIPKGKNTWRFTLEIKHSDSELLSDFNKLLSYDKPLITRNRERKGKTTKSSSLIIYNQEICNDLIRAGIGPNKSFTAQLPSLDQHLVRHLVRGLIDSDGSISKRPHKNDFTFDFIGSLDICDNISKFLFAHNIYNKTIVLHQYSGLLGRILMYRKKDLIKLRALLYDNAQLYLKRKKMIFDKISYKNQKEVVG